MANASNRHKGGQSGGGSGTIVSGQELARILGISRTTVTTYTKNGMPIYDNKGPRKAPRYDSALCIRWWKDREITKVTGGETEKLGIDEIRRRKELALMKDAEIDLAVKQERYGDIEAIMLELSACLGTIRGNLIALPAKLSAQLENQDAAFIERRLVGEIDDMLEELSEFSVDEDDDGD